MRREADWGTLVYFQPSGKIEGAVLLCAMALGAMFEAVNVGLVVPFVAVLRDPQLVFQSPMAQPLLTALGIREAQGLLIAMGRPYWNLRRQKPVIYCSYTAGFSVLRRARFTRHFWCGRHGLDLSRPAGSVHRDVVRFIESPPRTGAENRTTRVLPNPDNSCAYDIEPQSFDAMITKTQNTSMRS